MILVNIINIIHSIIILLVVVSPLISYGKLKEYAFIFLLYLLFQYVTGYERCGLTELEYLAMGEKYKEGFMYRLIKPMIKIPESYFNKYLFGIHLFYLYILYNQLKNNKN